MPRPYPPKLLRILEILVGARGFEPPTPCAQGRCATRLRYAPTEVKSSFPDSNLSHNQNQSHRGDTIRRGGYTEKTLEGKKQGKSHHEDAEAKLRKGDKSLRENAKDGNS